MLKRMRCEDTRDLEGFKKWVYEKEKSGLLCCLYGIYMNKRFSFNRKWICVNRKTRLG